MFLQRLVADNRSDGCGFQYDYMGSAEFEFGATRKARTLLAKMQIEGDFTGKAVRLFTKWGRSTYGPVDVYVFGSNKTIKDLGIAPPEGTKVPYDLMVVADKENPRLDNKDIIGFMSVNTDTPILIVRAEQANIDRGNKFLQRFIDEINAVEREAVKQELHIYENGYMLRRVTGPVYLPQNDGTPIEGGGQWVMFDADNKALDRDKYFTDITERFARRIGYPISTDD